MTDGDSTGVGGDDPRQMPPTAPPRRPRRTTAPSRLLVHTGDGRGKSTAAFGTMLRAVARGWQVAVVQFIKSGDWRVGEEQVGRELGVHWWSLGDGFTWDSDDMDRSQAVAVEAWRAAAELIAGGDHEMVVLDEITYPLNWGWIDAAAVETALRDRPQDVNIIATGRDAPGWLLALADTVTEMRAVRHAYDQGIMARRGIDF